jgi:hypothetical protein
MSKIAAKLLTFRTTTACLIPEMVNGTAMIFVMIKLTNRPTKKLDLLF